MRVTKWDVVGNIISSHYRKEVLAALKDNPKTPSMLEKDLGIKLSHVSRTLKDLEELKVVICLNPKLRKGRIYSITSLGNDILKELNKK